MEGVGACIWALKIHGENYTKLLSHIGPVGVYAMNLVHKWAY